MNGKKAVMLVFLAGMIFIAACTTQTSTGVTGAYANCFGDENQMVTAQFADFAPVSSEANPYQSREDIDVEVELTNKYTSDIAANNVKVRLTGDAAIPTIFSGAKVASAETLYAIDPQTCLTQATEANVGPIKYQGTITTKENKELTGLYCYQEPVVIKGYLYFTDKAENIGTTLPAGANPPSSVQVTKIEQNPVDINSGDASGKMRFKIYLANLGTGTIVPSLNDCFQYRDASYREEFNLAVKGAYTVDCPSDVKLSRGEKTDVVSCTVSNIDRTNIGADPSEITITLSGFAYEDTIPSTTVWIEP